MICEVKRIASITLFLLLFLITIGIADAANCGGNIACACGDTLNESRTLNASDILTGCGGNGLVIGASSITLDCNGTHISGPGTGSGLGISLNGADGVTIINCSITSFLYGISIDVDSDSNTIIYNNVSATNRGLFVSSPVALNNVSDNYFANNYEGIRFATPAIVSSGNNKIYHNNLHGNLLYGAYSGTSASAELSYNNEGNYWGNSACPLFTAGTDASPSGITDTYPYNETDGWKTHGPEICSKPIITKVTPSLDDVRMYGAYNFSMDITDLLPVAGVTIWNGTHDQPMTMSGGDAKDATWWAVVYLNALSEGARNLAVNATNGYTHNDTESFSVVVDKTGPTVNLESPADNLNTTSASHVYRFNASDDLYDDSQKMNCTVYLYNSTGGIVDYYTNVSTKNLTSTITDTMSFSHGQGVYTWNVTCFDKAQSNVLGGPGNTGISATYTVTYDNTAPTVTFVYNSTDLSKSTTAVTLNVTAVDTNTVAAVMANNASMTQQGATDVWSINAPPATFNCGSSGPCTVTFTANDSTGNSDSSTTTTITIDDNNPAVTGASVTNATRAMIGVAVNIQAVVADTAGVASVTVNGQTMYLLSGSLTSGTWYANETGTALGCPANALCTLTITATDSVGNVNNTATAIYTTDNVAPSNTTGFSVSPSSTGATVSATMDEAAKCTVIYSTNASNLDSSANAAAFSTSLSVSLSGLSASTVYYYKITDCWDAQGNSQNLNLGPFNFTTSAASPTGGGGGGGGTSITTVSINIGELTGGATERTLKRGDKILFRHGNEEHYVKVKTIGRDYVLFEIASSSQEVRLNIDEKEDIDFDSDGTEDISVQLLDIMFNRALVKITSLVEQKRDTIELLPPRPPIRRSEAETAAESASGEVSAEAVVEQAPAPIESVTQPVTVPPVEQTAEWNIQKKISVTFLIIGAFGAVLFMIIRMWHRKSK